MHHKPSWPFPLEVEREQQARRAASAMEGHAGGRPAVVLGDFDATPDSASIDGVGPITAATVRNWLGRTDHPVIVRPTVVPDPPPADASTCGGAGTAGPDW